MSEHSQILEPYLQAKFRDKPALSITQLEKLRDGWESDNYILTVESGSPPKRTTWVWRIYSGAGSQVKAAHEFTSLKKLHAAGYPVPQVVLLEAEHSPVNRPFIILEYVQGEMMWHLIDISPGERQAQLVDQFCDLFVLLHTLDWRLFDGQQLSDAPFFFIDQWLDEARGEVQKFPGLDASPFLEWVAARRSLFNCPRPSPVHRDFHPGNILIRKDNSAMVIDWTGFAISDARFDLAWTLVLAHAHGRPGLRDEIFRGYQRYAGKPVEQIEAFEAIACARRLLSVAVSLTQGAQRMGMNTQAVAAMRATMEAHRRVYRLFIERTGLQFETFDRMFGNGG